MMNHDGSQQYTFGYGLATTPQIQQLQQQQQQIQLQQHHFQQHQAQQHPQILQQHQGNPTASIPTQNVFQLQVGGNPAAAAILQQNDNTAAASPTIVQHAGLISQPVIHASISVSLENTINKPLQVQGLNNTMEAAMVYPQPQHQGSGLKIITNSGSFMPQQQPEIHFQSLATGDNLGNAGARSGIFDGVAGSGGVVAATQSNIGNAFGKQTFSGWVRGDVTGGNQQQQYNVGQNATLPSFGHLWSQFQQQKTQVNIIQQQQQQQQPMQVHQFQSPHAHIAQQAPQQFTVSGMQNVNNIQMIKVQQAPNALQDQTVLQPSAAPAAHLFQSCATPVQQSVLLTAQHTSNSSPLPQISCLSSSLSSISQTSAATLVSTDPTRNTGVMVGQVSPAMSGLSGKLNSTPVSTKKSSKSVQRKIKSISQDAHSLSSSLSPSTVQGVSSSVDNAVRIRPSNRKVLSESGPPKVTVTLDSLPSTNNLSQFPDKPDSLHHQVVKVASAEKGIKFSHRNQLGISSSKFDRTQSSLSWQHQSHTNGSPEKKKLVASNHLTSSTGSSLDRPSSEDSNFSSPPYSFTPPSSIDSVFSPSSLKDMTHHTALNSADIFSPTLPLSSSSVKSSSSSPPPSILSTTTVSPSSLETICYSSENHLLQTLNDNDESLSSTHDNDGLLVSSTSPSPSFSQTSMFTNSLISASCCSIAITTTSVTSSSPRTYKGDIAIAASVHSLSPLSSPGISSKSKKPHHRIAGGLNSKKIDHQKQVRVPYSWQRNLDDGVVVYLSPSGTVLTSIDEIRDYLLSHDTCKCGLECPFQLEDVFVFDPTISSMPWSKVTGHNSSDNIPMGNLCNHRREILAMAAFHQSQSHARQVLSDSDNGRGRKREGRKSLNSGDDFVISPHKKLRTSITNAVNRHALLRNNNTSPANSNSNIPSPMSELENSWPKDDDVFFPISTNLNNNITDKVDLLHNVEESFPLSSDLSLNRSLKAEKRHKFLNNSENLVYSNHHPSQRLGSKGHPSNHHNHTHQNVPLLSHDRHKSPSSTFSPHSGGDQLLYHHHQSSSSHENQKSTGSILHNNNNCDTVDKERDTLSLATSPNLLCYNEDDSDSGMLFSQKESRKIGCSGNEDNIPPCSFTPDIDEIKSDFHSQPHTPSSLSAVSFFENPTVFVAQQTAMINNSISSCNINSPSPGFLDDSVTLVEPKGSGEDEVVRSKSSVFLVSEEEDVGDENTLDTSREDDEEHKGNTDLESNKSFSDTTENNDSAYLSQTGSDQEKSDTVDGLDCLSKLSDVYDFNTSEDQLGNVSTAGRNLRGSLSEQASEFRDSGIDISEYRLCEAQLIEDVVGNEKFALPAKGSGNKSSKCKQNRLGVFKKKGTAVSGMATDGPQGALSSPSFEKSNSLVFSSDKTSAEQFDTSVCSSGSLNSDLSQLLASNNWNIPALQKVLAQHSAGDPEHLRQVIQQMMTQITSPNDSSYPTTKDPACSLNSSAVSNVAAAFITNSAKKGIKQETLIERSVNNTSTSDKINAAASRSIKVLPGFEKNKASVTEEKVDQQIVGSNAGISGILSTATSKANPATKQEHTSKPLQPKHNSHKGTLSSTVGNVSNIASALSTKVTTLSPSTTAAVPQQCNSLQSSLILNTVKPQTAQVMSVSCSNNDSATTTTTTAVINVSKPLQMAQVIPSSLTGINQATTVLPAQQFLSTCSAPAQQLLNPHHQHPSSQNSPQQQIMNMNMNSLSLPALNNQQLFISNNPIQQASPSSVAAAQLSPAMAAAAGQILAAQTQQHQQSALQQQMSPSFIPTAQMPKPCSVSISSLAISNNTPGIPIVAGNNPTGVVDATGSIPQGPNTALTGNVITGPPQNSAAVVAAANASVYSSATNQPVFVIPQAKPVQPPPPPSVVQLVGGSSQTINATANGLQAGDMNMNQILNQISVDQNQQLQNLINAASTGGFNPAAAAATLGGIQQQQATWSAVNLNAQQQQQLQLLQLQQLMLPTVIGNQTQTLPSASVCCPPQTSSLMNAMVGQQGLQINQVVDVKTIQQNLNSAAVAQGFNNHPLPSVAAPAAFSNQIQQMASPLTVQVGSANTNQAIPTINPQVSLAKSINIIQHQQPPPPQQQALQTCLPSAIDSALKNPTPSSIVPVSANKIIAAQSSQTITSNKTTDKEMDINTQSQAQPQQLTTISIAKSTTVVSSTNTINNSTVLTKSTNTTTSKTSSSKSKSKSKKSDGTKVKDPQVAKEEEHIANAVNQILAQAVQQQRELTLAAQNAPPPPPKSRNRKRDSQARARQAAAAQAAAALQKAKEQELGKIASISDDAVFHHPLQPPKALSTHTPPLPVHNLSNGSSPLSASSQSYSPTTSNTFMNCQEPLPQSLSHLVSNDNNSASNQFAISSSQSSNNAAVRSAASPSLPPPSMSSLTSESMVVHSALPSLPNEASSLSEPSAARLTFISTPSSTLAAAPSSLSSKTVIHRHNQQGAQTLALSKNAKDPSSFDSQMAISPPLGGMNCSNSKTTFGNSNKGMSNVGKNKNALPPVATSTILNNNSTASLRKSPLLVNPLSSVVSISGSKSLPSSTSSSTSSPPKKSNISLKEHLSSIVFSKDKESGKKKSMATSKTTKSNSAITESSTTATSTLASLSFSNDKPVAKASRSITNGGVVGKTGR